VSTLPKPVITCPLGFCGVTGFVQTTGILTLKPSSHCNAIWNGASIRANGVLVSTCFVVPSAVPGPGTVVKRSSSSIFPRGCVGSSPVWFAKFSSSEPARAGLPSKRLLQSRLDVRRQRLIVCPTRRRRRHVVESVEGRIRRRAE
jgi:hypothetical protein